MTIAEGVRILRDVAVQALNDRVPAVGQGFEILYCHGRALFMPCMLDVGTDIWVGATAGLRLLGK